MSVSFFCPFNGVAKIRLSKGTTKKRMLFSLFHRAFCVPLPKTTNTMTYGVIGTGAIGGYYGAKLAHTGKGVHFLFHKDYDHVRAHGLQVDSCDGSFHLDNVNAYRNTQDMPQCDVVLVGLKSVNNHLLKELLPPLLKEDTLVVLIQNGIGIEADVQKMFPTVQLSAGLAFICCAKTEPGKVHHQCYGYINIGNYSCSNQERIDAVIDDFRRAGVDANEVEYLEARWKKAVWNMPFNGMTVALNTQTDTLLRNPSTLQLVKDQMMEVICAAQACGVKNIDATFADKMIDNTLHMTPYSPSMKLDFDFHRPMEIDYLYTRPIEEARKAGYSMKKLEMLEQELRFMECTSRTITTLIFDLDGTLMNTLDDLHNSVSHALQEAGLKPNDKQDTRSYLGNGIKALVDKSVMQSKPDADEALKEHIFATFRTHYKAHSMDETAPYKGIPEMLKTCKEKGFFTAIVSNKLDPAVKDLHKAFFGDTIDLAIGEKPNIKRKPAPDMVNEAISQLSVLHGRDIQKSECIYIGDSEVDLQTAQNSALPCIAVSWGFRDRDFLVAQGAKVIIDHPTELFNHL